MNKPVSQNEEIPRNFAEIIFLIARRVAPILFLTSLLCLGFVIFWANPLDRDVEEKPEGAEARAPLETQGLSEAGDRSYSAEELRRENELGEALINERGGRVFLTGMRSRKISGTAELGGQIVPVVLVQMAPDRVVLRLLKATEQLSLGYDGDQFWKVLTRKNGERISMNLNPVELDLLRTLQRIHGPLLDKFLDGRGRLVSVENVQDTQLPLLRVRFVPYGESRAQTVDLGTDRLELLRWERRNTNEDVFAMMYSDYEEIDGKPEPTEIEFWRNGEMEFDLSVEQVVRNFGAVQVLFENPLDQSGS